MNATDPVIPQSDPIPPAPGMAPAPVEEPVSVTDWLITYLIMAIPLVNIVMAFIWAFGENTKPSKANWAKAMLIISLIALVLGGCIAGLSFLLAFSGSGSY